MNSKLERIRLVVVVGAGRDREKWGYKALMRLGQLGYRVMGVNPKHDAIDRVRCIKSVAEVTESMLSEWEIGLDQVLVLTVVPAKVTEKVVEEMSKAGLRKLWMQTGSSSETAVKQAGELGIEVLGTDCVVVDGLKETWI